jgi:hypothetical protein
MIGGRGYQALDPLCVLAPDHCSPNFSGSAHWLPAARGPPLPSSAGFVSDGYDAGPGGGAALAQLRLNPRVRGIQYARAYAPDPKCPRLGGPRSWIRPARTHEVAEAVPGRWCYVSAIAATLMMVGGSAVTWLCVSARWRHAHQDLLAKVAGLQDDAARARVRTAQVTHATAEWSAGYKQGCSDMIKAMAAMHGGGADDRPPQGTTHAK